MNNIVLKCIPLCIKKIAFVLGSLKMKKQFSMTVLNDAQGFLYPAVIDLLMIR